MKMENWIEGHVNAFEYFEGVPQIIVPDNTKTAVVAD
jgi:transposase